MIFREMLNPLWESNRMRVRMGFGVFVILLFAGGCCSRGLEHPPGPVTAVVHVVTDGFHSEIIVPFDKRTGRPVESLGGTHAAIGFGEYEYFLGVDQSFCHTLRILFFPSKAAILIKEIPDLKAYLAAPKRTSWTVELDNRRWVKLMRRMDAWIQWDEKISDKGHAGCGSHRSFCGVRNCHDFVLDLMIAAEVPVCTTWATNSTSLKSQMDTAMKRLRVQIDRYQRMVKETKP